MHHLEGQSSWFDRIRRVMLSNSIELEVTPDRARLLIGGRPGEPKREVVFTRPTVVSSMGIVAQVIEEEGGIDNTSAPSHFTRWLPCPACNGRGGDFDNNEIWQDCHACHGAGLVPEA